MKARYETNNVENAIKRYQYQILRDTVHDVSSQMIAAVLYSFLLKGYSAEEIRTIYEDVQAVLLLDDSLNVTGGNMVKYIKDKTGVDLDKELIVKTETEREYLAR